MRTGSAGFAERVYLHSGIIYYFLLHGITSREGQPNAGTLTPMDRYSRQRLLRVIGSEGQDKLERARVAVIGLGALGSAAAECLVRAGVGEVILIDRDILELTNLQRQILYDEDDVNEGLPKAVAAQRRLMEINSSVKLDARTENLHAGNVESLLAEVPLILDGTDNVETRYLVNDFAVKRGVPWIYGGAIGTTGVGLFVMPGSGPCLRCVFPDPPDAEKLGTCDTVGVLGTIPLIIGAWQATMAMRYLVGGSTGLGERMLMMDPWEHGFLEPVVKARGDCPACAKGEFPFLESRKRTTVAGLCGSGAYQITPPGERSVEFEDLSKRLEKLGEVELTPFYLRFSDDRARMILFKNGGARVEGVADEREALSFYARYVGH
jgi:molybdopterin/thiamine biosynthesis adenylyltransferase